MFLDCFVTFSLLNYTVEIYHVYAIVLVKSEIHTACLYMVSDVVCDTLKLNDAVVSI